MLNVQLYLETETHLGKSKEEALEKLNSTHGILYKLHEDGRVILDYDQIKSIKSDYIVRECRGLVLDSKDWSLVAKGFTRFFNAGEHRPDDLKFNWGSGEVCGTHKEDGSFILLYFYNGEWRTNTRFSFCEHNVQDFPLTWRQLFDMASSHIDLSLLNKDYTYVCELCSRYNKVVRDYETPSVYLLSIFHGEMELNHSVTVDEGLKLGFELPKNIVFKDIFDAQMYIAKLAEEDKTFEGLVLRDCFNNRLKVKSDYYIALHRLNNNGNLANAKNIIPLIMKGETEEVIVYFPELKPRVMEIDSQIKKIKNEIDNVWFCHHDEKNQKRFALAVTKDTKYTSPLFSAKKLGGHPFDYLTAEYLTKYIG